MWCVDRSLTEKRATASYWNAIWENILKTRGWYSKRAKQWGSRCNDMEMQPSTAIYEKIPKFAKDDICFSKYWGFTEAK